jgi:D-beta-D-heptose 7-phosphate kinase/D-beta-D-heptose 1-phosphate adenosyltransferase
MKKKSRINHKIFDRDTLAQKVAAWKKEGSKIVFTNGCFDILHKGHLQVLQESASFGDILIVGLNTDASVKKLKGDQRPVNDEAFRTLMMANLEIVDAVTVFPEDTPLELIKKIRPDVIVKGGDYTPEQVVGCEVVLLNGGEIKIVPIVKGYSTTAIIDAIQKL